MTNPLQTSDFTELLQCKFSGNVEKVFFKKITQANKGLGTEKWEISQIYSAREASEHGYPSYGTDLSSPEFTLVPKRCVTIHATMRIL